MRFRLKNLPASPPGTVDAFIVGKASLISAVNGPTVANPGDYVIVTPTNQRIVVPNAAFCAIFDRAHDAEHPQPPTAKVAKVVQRVDDLKITVRRRE